MSRPADPPRDPAPLPSVSPNQSPSQSPSQSPRTSRARTSVVPQGDGPSGPDLIPAVLPDPAIARLAVQSTATFAERLADLSIGALADSQALARRWATETTERLLLLARPPERPQDVMHAMAGFVAAQGDLATAQVGRAMALAQKVQVETMGLAAEAGQAFAQETAAAMHRATRTGAARG